MPDKTTPDDSKAAEPETELVTGKKKRAPVGSFGEIGSTGLKQSGGFILEEFLNELKGTRGVRLYREMSENSPVIGALLLGYRQVAMHLPWEIREPEEATGKDKAATKFIQDAFNDLDMSWESTLHQILSELTFGWSLHEVVYKKRDDGKIGWSRFPIRSQETLMNWVLGDHGAIEAMVQLDPVTGQRYTIPMGKAMLFRTTAMKNNPEGQSMLRPAVIPYQYVRRIQEYEAIGVERDLAGLPVAWVPEEWINSDAPNAKKALASITQMVRDVRRNEREGLVMPMIYHDDLTGQVDHNRLLDFELLASSGARQFDTDKIITRYNQQIAMSLLGDFVTMGHEGVGSFALGKAKMDLWVMVVDSLCKGIAEVFNKDAIVKLLDLNGIQYDHAPELDYGSLSNVDIAGIGSYIAQLATAGILTPDETTENWLREQAGMPPLDPDVEPIYDREPTNPLTGLPLSQTPMHDPNDPKNKFPQLAGAEGKVSDNPDAKVTADQKAKDKPGGSKKPAVKPKGSASAGGK